MDQRTSNHVMIRAAACAVVTALAGASIASASEISIHFIDGTSASVASNAAAAGAPGAAIASYWNNLNVANITQSNSVTFSTLVDSGNASQTGMNLVVKDFFPGSSDVEPNLAGTAQDTQLFTGLIGTNNSVLATASTITISGLTYGAYDVYVYFTDLSTSTGSSSVSDGLGQEFYTGPGETSTSYVLASTFSTATSASDYAEFTNESASSLTLTVTGPASAGVYVTGIQIVSTTPEPACVGLLGTAGAVALLRRRGKIGPRS